MTPLLDRHRRRMIQSVGAIAATSALPARAQATQSFSPKRTVRFIVPLSDGGVADVATRAMVPELQRVWKQNVIVENKPGGMFAIGMQSLIQEPTDGHTLLYLFNSMATIQAVHKRFDLQKELQPITQTTVCPMIVMVGSDSPFKTLKDLVAYGRANPNKLSYASLGVGSIEHLKSAQFEQIAGFKATNIPYKAGPEMAKAVMAGEVDYVLIIGSFGPLFVPSAKARVLAVLDDKRMKELPDVPTTAEAGFQIPPLSYWGGYAVRAGTPPDIVQQLYGDIARAAVAPAVADAIAKMSLVPTISKVPNDFRGVISSDLTWMTAIAESLQLKPES